MNQFKSLVLLSALISNITFADTSVPFETSLPPSLNETPQPSIESALLFKQLDNKTGECTSEYNNAEGFSDPYFDSLSYEQKVRLVMHLQELAFNKCVAYEEALFLKTAILNNDIKFVKMYANLVKPRTDPETKKVMDSLDKREINRLSKLPLFSQRVEMDTFQFIKNRDFQMYLK
ncbi:hypothetical protein ACTFQF_16060 [Aliivibrio fischeri]|uniref:hypothetical protein n=1 Tax=Aliivibrio fischeri TaxID=668 RepID=UPI0007C47F26|nr:hypothetical protein [Aliivibrio fischeri]MBP3140150.1 hypothetical protein [Aliivibrio fischeri]MBP3154532.1 hypothetical protein [Aliivibrio fischeri]MCE7572274.1 hypothetical protein [Aliivibrio fischeri]